MQKSFIPNTPVDNAVFTVREDHTLAVKLLLGNGGSTEAVVTPSVYENEYDLPQSLSSFDSQDGFTLLGMESVGGIRKLRCRIAPEGVGILNWRKTQ